eukprot:CAMPEP_0179125058 /NCGR_PEP_ID=MMETSP0796-20121207/59127_1 /TAXON_ID=73915 /ORGANISM="Pyrodinium bahamense, Strain pbaha01" /LENGTH=54 /DNA_ID=CAMNT_0020823743 /DNA_START=56 /DNA_END=217 /DNA_ORIENTATION=-
MPSSASAYRCGPGGLVRFAACALLHASLAGSASTEQSAGPGNTDAPVIVPLRRE